MVAILVVIAVTKSPGDNMGEEVKINAIIYPDKKKIGCVLQQAIVGGNGSICHLFDAQVWEVGGFEGMKKVSGTKAEWTKLADHWNKYHKDIREVSNEASTHG